MDLCRRTWARKECPALLCSANSPTNQQRGLAPHPSSISTPILHSLLSCLPAAPQRCSGSQWHPQHSPPALGNALGSLSLGEPGPLRAWDKALGVLGKMGGKALSWGEQTSSQPHTTDGETPPWHFCRGSQGRVVLKEHEISPSSSSLQVWQ